MEGPKTLWIGKSWQTDAENCGLIAEIIMATEEKLYEDDIEYIRADLARPEVVKRLVEAARAVLSEIRANICFPNCSLKKECSEDSGDACLWMKRLKVVLEGEG